MCTRRLRRAIFSFLSQHLKHKNSYFGGHNQEINQKKKYSFSTNCNFDSPLCLHFAHLSGERWKNKTGFVNVSVIILQIVFPQIFFAKFAQWFLEVCVLWKRNVPCHSFAQGPPQMSTFLLGIKRQPVLCSSLLSAKKLIPQTPQWSNNLRGLYYTEQILFGRTDKWELCSTRSPQPGRDLCRSPAFLLWALNVTTDTPLQNEKEYQGLFTLVSVFSVGFGQFFNALENDPIYFPALACLLLSWPKRVQQVKRPSGFALAMQCIAQIVSPTLCANDSSRAQSLFHQLVIRFLK